MFLEVILVLIAIYSYVQNVLFLHEGNLPKVISLVMIIWAQRVSLLV